MSLLQNQASQPAPVISTVNRSIEGGPSVMPYALAALAVAVLCAVVLGYRLLSLQAGLRDVTTQQDQLVAEYDSLSSIRQRVANVSALAKGLEVVYAAQAPIANLVNVIESTSYKPAKYDSVSIDKQGEVRISGSVSTYHEFAKLVKAFKGSEKDIEGVTKTVTIDSVGQSVSTDEADAGATTTTFSISFILQPTITGDSEVTE